MTPEERFTRASNALAVLAEHFDSVQIVTTWREPGSGHTNLTHCGSGNWYAREGSVREWLTRMEEQSKVACWRSEAGD